MKAYHSVTLRLIPTLQQEKYIDHKLLKVSKFLGVSKILFQKNLWQKARAEKELHESHTRLLDLLSQRFANTVMGQLLYPLDKRNYKFVRENGWYKIEVRFNPKEKTLINVAKSNMSYYADIIEKVAHPAFIYKYGADYFLSVAVPFEKRYEKNRSVVYVGIDLNQRKHSASLYNPKTNKYEENLFFDLRPIDERIQKIQRNISEVQKGKRNNQLSTEEKEQINRFFERIRKTIDKGHGDFIAKLIEVADEYWDKGYNIIFKLEDLKGITKRIEKSYAPFNRWLHSQLCYRRFAVILESKHYLVEYINPRNTSKICHRCGERVTIYGEHQRLIKCICGLKDFSRDLNASRNIVKLKR